MHDLDLNAPMQHEGQKRKPLRVHHTLRGSLTAIVSQYIGENGTEALHRYPIDVAADVWMRTSIDSAIDCSVQAMVRYLWCEIPR